MSLLQAQISAFFGVRDDSWEQSISSQVVLLGGVLGGSRVTTPSLPTLPGDPADSVPSPLTARGQGQASAHPRVVVHTRSDTTWDKNGPTDY